MYKNKPDIEMGGHLVSRAYARESIKQTLLETWLPLAAIAQINKLSNLVTKRLLDEMVANGLVLNIKVRFDAHNNVNCYKKAIRETLMGVPMVVDTIKREADDYDGE